MRKKELIAAAIITLVFILLYFFSPKPVEFSPIVSLIIVILLAMAFVWMFIRTIRGRLVGRRLVFLLVGIALLAPFFMQFALPLQISPEVQSAYDAMEELPHGAVVLTAFDYDPPSAPELQPMAEAFMKYAFKRGFKVIIMGLWPQGPQQATQAIEAAMETYPEFRDKIDYGKDYVNLGFQSGNEFVIVRMGESFKAMFPADVYFTPYDSIPMLENVNDFSDVAFAMNFSAGKPGTVEWVQIAVDRYQLPMAACNTAVQAPMAYPYLKAKQLVGLMGGMTGGAEMEELTGEFGKATTFLLSQSFAHLAVILFVIIGNCAYFSQKTRKK